MKKAAVVIGVNKTGSLTPLNSAADGAGRVAKWLENEGFTVKCLTDKTQPLKYWEIEEAVAKFVTNPPRYHLLVVYFSGHGYWQARSDTWLLSEAPVKANEAINLEAAMDLAKYSGIKTVVFVSDACRSLPDSRSGAFVSGGSLFPNYATITTASKIDYFKATSEARSAYEGPINGRSESLLTSALMAAYVEPEPHMVRQMVEQGTAIEVVPNRRLEDYLQRKVDALLLQINVNDPQQLDINVPSSEDIYISRVHRTATPSPAPTFPVSPPSDGQLAAMAITRSLSTRQLSGGRDLALELADATADSKVNKRLPDENIDHFESEMGFVIHGGSVARSAVFPGGPLTAELLQTGDGEKLPGLVRVSRPNVTPVQEQDICSVGVQLGNGQGVVLAGLPGYIGHARFKREGLATVSYVPSAQHWRYSLYKERRAEIDRLRAMVALAVDRNKFRVSSERDAEELASRIRMYKGVDPTLGLYAACAFSQASNDRQLLSILHYMREDLRADLFDVRLLASRHAEALNNQIPVTPVCPMLTQNWSLLRSRRVTLYETLQASLGSLCDSLWTTFEPEAATRIIDAIEKGELK